MDSKEIPYEMVNKKLQDIVLSRPSDLQGSARAHRKPSGLAQQEELPKGWTAYAIESSGTRRSFLRSANDSAQEASVESVWKEVSHSHVVSSHDSVIEPDLG